MKHKSFRDDPKYVRIEQKWHAAYRRRERAYSWYIRENVVTLELMRKRRVAIDAAERALAVWRTQLDERRAQLIRRWRTEGTL